ncbi:amidase family protein [Goekera deserti]|uniref:Amidase n=1 Tax=Goekera deserti TaxID=2497753 RepID=A0A7K3WBR4_9ACTN|nr:amidase family protein [Goekera deserti]NDI48008.1 amidase [Goekera deserti]NEL53756.1 amidase [Goekera deserti]
MLNRPDLLTDATTTLAALATGELGAEQLTAACLDRITGPGAALGAVVAVDAAGALAAARAVDADRAAGRPPGPLAGLPVTVKDSIDARGLRSSHGRESDARLATQDAPVVRRLREAGAVVLGKTKVPAYLAHLHTWDDSGPTRNPWDPARSSGGSSGGASAAVAAGLAFADLGSDLAGSLRVPASWCGLFGHRPSTGLVSKLGNMPWPDGGLLEPMVSAVGPFARSARDTELLMSVLPGAEGPEAVAWRVQLPPPRVRSLRGLRVAVWLDDPDAPVDTETRSALHGLADRLSDAGARVTELTDPPVRAGEHGELAARLCAGEVVHGLDDAAWAEVRARAADGDPVAQRFTVDLRQALTDLEAQRAATARWQQTFTGLDVVLCPAVPRAAVQPAADGSVPARVPLDGVPVDLDVLSDWSRLSSLGRLPATVVPLGPGERSGLPVGAQLLGPYLEDRTPLRAAVLAERAGLVGFAPPPGW